MTKTISILGIIIIGLGLVWSRFFPHGETIHVLSDTLSYVTLHKDIDLLKEKTNLLTQKMYLLFKVKSSEKPLIEVDTEPQQIIEEKKGVDRSNITADNILYFTNLERTKIGLKPLVWNAKLTRSSNAKSRDMFVNQYFAHTSPTDKKKDFGLFIKNESYEYVRVSENLAMGEFSTASEVVTAWMNSRSHRANILFPDFENIGASVEYGSYQGSHVVIIVQHFGIPKKACPSVSSSLLLSIRDIEVRANSFKDTAEILEKEMNSPSISKFDLDEIISTYNTTIENYNQLVRQLQRFTEEYNEMVVDYDNCVKKLNHTN